MAPSVCKHVPSMDTEDDECSVEAEWSIIRIVMEAISGRAPFEIDPMRSANIFMAVIES